MAKYSIDLVCDECYELLEWDIVEGATIDRLYVKPCKHCAAQQTLALDSAEVCQICSSPAIRSTGYCALHDDPPCQ